MNVGAAQSPDSALASIILRHSGYRRSAKHCYQYRHRPASRGSRSGADSIRPYHLVVFQHAADKAAEDARFRTIDMLRFRSRRTRRCALPSLALIVSLFVSADMVGNMLNAIPEFVTRGLQIAGGFIVVVGYAMVLRMMGVLKLPDAFFFPRVYRWGYLGC